MERIEKKSVLEYAGIPLEPKVDNSHRIDISDPKVRMAQNGSPTAPEVSIEFKVKGSKVPPGSDGVAARDFGTIPFSGPDEDGSIIASNEKIKLRISDDPDAEGRKILLITVSFDIEGATLPPPQNE